MTTLATKEQHLHKPNEVIRGGNPYSLNAQRLGNAISRHVQKNKLFEKKPFEIPVQDVLEIMNLQNSNAYTKVIKRSLEELSKSIVLYGKDALAPFHKSGQETLWKTIQFVLEPELIKKGKQIYIKGTMSDNMRTLLAFTKTKGNFTPLVLNMGLNSLKTKHANVLYEYIESYKTHKILKKRVEIKQERLDMMFNLVNSKKYKYFSSFLPVLERCIEDINENTDMYLKLAVDKKAKKYIIYRIFDYDKKQKTPTVVIDEKKDKEIHEHPLGLFNDD